MKYCAIIILIMTFFLAGCAPQGVVIRPAPAPDGLKETVIAADERLFVWDKIAVIDVDGVMTNAAETGLLGGGTGENPVSLFVEKLSRAAGDKRVKAVVLRINSPGGTVAASDAMHHALREFRRTTGKPVVACMLDMAASGGYYLACGCNGIMAQPSTVTGSIGVIFQTISFEGTMGKIGMKATAVKSGELKDIASPLKDLSPAEYRVLHGVVMGFFKQFTDVVLDGRPNLTAEALEPLADGRVFTAQAALEAGLIDRIGYPDEATAWAKKLAGTDRVKVVMYHRPMGYAPNYYAAWDGSAKTGALLNIELPQWLQSSGPQFLYLWQP